MSQFDKVSVIKKSNVYFDGKCVSHTILLEDGSRTTIGVIFPSMLTFSTSEPELMEVVAGRCRVRLEGGSDWEDHGPGSRFSVPAISRFDIETLELLDYVCHFGG